MSKTEDKKQRARVSSSAKKMGNRQNVGVADEHAGHVATTRNMPPHEKPAEYSPRSATGIGGRRSAGARSPGTINEVPLTTETGTISETEQNILNSPYGQVLPPHLLSPGQFKCRVCNQIFADSNTYAAHYKRQHA